MGKFIAWGVGDADAVGITEFDNDGIAVRPVLKTTPAEARKLGKSLIEKAKKAEREQRRGRS